MLGLVVLLATVATVATVASDVPITLHGADEETSSAYATFSTDKTGRVQPVGFFSTQLDEVQGVPLNLVQGGTPEWLSGSLYRVGAALYELGGRRATNILDGLSKVYRWEFSPGSAPKLTSKFLKSRVYNRTIAQGELAAMKHMGDMVPELTWLEQFRVTLEMLYYGNNDNNNIAVWELTDEAITLMTESPLYIDVDQNTLEFREEFRVVPDDIGMFEKELLSASHFARHPSSGDSINYKLVVPLIPGYKPAYYMVRYSTGPAGGAVATTIAKLPVTMAGMRIIHSVGATERYAILPRFSLGLSFTANSGKTCDVIRYDPNNKVMMDVFALKDGKHKGFEFPANEAQHIINSFERYNAENELEIVADFPTKNDMSEYPTDQCFYQILDIRNILDEEFLYEKHWSSMSDIRIRRYILNMDTGTGSLYEYPQMWLPNSGLQVEFPFINDHYRGKEYCFTYFQTMQYDVRVASGLIKVDMCKQTSTGWEEVNKFPVEPVFAARPGGVAEDDGVILSPVFDSTTNTTELYIWSAKDLTVLAKLDSPLVVPFTLHGIWKEG